MKTIQFRATDRSRFEKELREEVRQLMKSKKPQEEVTQPKKSKKVTRDGGSGMIWKAVLLVSVYLTLNMLPYFISFPLLVIIILSFFIGLAKDVIGTGVMHDGNHGSASSNPKINYILGATLWLAGGYIENWKMQHNMIHHTNTNVHEHDDDIDGHGLLRFHPHQEWKPIHRFQVFFAPFLYGLMTFLWVTTKDFSQAFTYNKRYNSGEEMYKPYRDEKMKQHLMRIILIKILYWTAFFVLPLLFWKCPWWYVVVYFLTMHFTAGLFLGLVFQPAHVSKKTIFEVDFDTRSSSRLEHQIRTSCNYATKNRFLTWLVGGLNFQIEHHLFPNISHVHYRKIAPIVKRKCEQYGIPYNEYPSFWTAIVDHFKFLWQLGTKPSLT